VAPSDPPDPRRAPPAWRHGGGPGRAAVPRGARALAFAACVALTALLFALAFPPAKQRLLAWVALVPFLVALRRARTLRGALALATATGVAMAWSIGRWMPGSIETYYLQPRLVGWAFFFAVALVMVCPYYVAFAWLERRIARWPLPWRPLLVAAAWTAAELARGRLLTGTPVFIGNPWGLMGYSQAGAPLWMQTAALGGVYAVGFVLVAANAGLAELWPGRARWRDGRLQRAIAFAFAPTLLAAAYGGWALSASGPSQAAAGRAVRVAWVQPNLSVGSVWRRDLYGRNLEAHLDLTAVALAEEPAPQIVFWPESAMSFFLEQEPLYRAAIERLLARTGTELVAGAPRSAGDGMGPYWNSIYLLRPGDGIVARYDKRFLVPFGEYFPFGGVGLLRREFGPAREFTAGAGDQLLPTAAGPAGILVCNEGMLPEVAGQRVAAGATYLVNPSNDTWIPDDTFAALQFDVISYRAVEQRRWLVRASSTGPSALVDPQGRVHERTPPFVPAVAAGTLVGRLDRSPYGRLGDTFALACAVLAIGAASWAPRPHPDAPTGA